MNKPININNYEQFAIDYLEGNLDKVTKKAFEDFLKQNPTIKEELENLLEFKLSPKTDFNFEEKLNLMKSEIEDISLYEYLCIVDIEGTITIEEKNQLKNIFKKNPELLIEYKQFIKTKLEAEKTKYPSPKHKLKQSEIEKISYIQFLLIAKAEGIISTKENIDLKDILSNNENYKRDLKLYQSLKLEPDKGIVYPNKRELKHTNNAKILTIGTVISALAAMLIIFLGIKSFIEKKHYETGNSCVISTETRFHKETIKKEYEEKVNDLINEANDNLFPNSYNQVVVEDNISDTTSSKNDEYFESNNYEKVLAYEDVEKKEINLKLTQLKEHKRRYSNITKSYIIPNQYNMIAKSDNTNKAQKVVNFLVTAYNSLTENDVSMKIEIDEKNKCYGLEVNEKDYEICFSDKKFLRKF